MFNLKPSQPTELDNAIVSVFNRLSVMEPETEEYAKVAEQLVKLKKLKKETEPSMPISPEVLLTTGVNLLGILLIIRYERTEIITSKALGFVKKLW